MLDVQLFRAADCHTDHNLVVARVFCLRCKSEIRQVDLCEVSEGENKNDLQNLREDMEELNDLLKSAIRTSVKEVILYDINVILAKNQ
jgi:hypothetical protein